MLQLDARLDEIWGFSPLIFVRGHFYEISIAALLFRVKPHHVKSFENFGLQTSEKVSWKKKEKETCAKHKIDRSQNGRSNNRLQCVVWRWLNACEVNRCAVELLSLKSCRC